MSNTTVRREVTTTSDAGSAAYTSARESDRKCVLEITLGRPGSGEQTYLKSEGPTGKVYFVKCNSDQVRARAVRRQIVRLLND